MRSIVVIVILFVGISTCFSQTTNPNYDSTLAVKLGADDYGMRRFTLVILKTGTNITDDNKFINECFKGHPNNINRLVEEGKLLIAGPLSINDNSYRGIFILNIADQKEAKELLQTDTAIRENLLDFELYNWYWSAALSEYFSKLQIKSGKQIHNKLLRKNFSV